MKKLIILHGNAEETKAHIAKPFSSEEYNVGYAHFSILCKSKGIRCLIAAPSAYKTKSINSGWNYNGEEWLKTGIEEAHIVQDRFSGQDRVHWAGTYEALCKEEIPCVNHLTLESICKDKLQSAAFFADEFVPTLPIEGPVDLNFLKKILRKRCSSDDVQSDKLVFKPRYGKGGSGFYVSERKGYVPPKLLVHYVVQPFLETKEGIPELGISQRHDLRLIMMNGRAVYAEARSFNPSKVANEDDEVFCPKGDACDTSVISIEKIPPSFIDTAKKVDELISDFKHRVYSVDMGRGSSGQPYIFELNTRFSIGWSDPKQELLVQGRKDLQTLLVDEIVRQVGL